MPPPSVLSGAVENSAVNVRRHGRLAILACVAPVPAHVPVARVHSFERRRLRLEYAVPVGIVAVVLAAAVTAITSIGTSVGNTAPPFTPDADPT